MRANPLRIAVIACFGAALAASCVYAPQGRCTVDEDCLASQHCSGEVCVSNPLAVNAAATPDGGSPDAGPVIPTGGPCSGPDVFDPAAVSLNGSLEGPSCRSAVAAWETPDIATGAFSNCDAEGFVVNPVSGRMTSWDFARQGIYELHADPVETRATEHCGRDWHQTRVDPNLNDVRLATPGCESATRVPFLITPDTGALWFSCSAASDSQVFDATGAVVFDATAFAAAAGNPGGSVNLYAVGRGGIVLADDGSHGSYFVGPAQTLSPTLVTWTLAPGESVALVRAKEDGFLVMTATTTVARLWRVGADGSAEDLGAYPHHPSAIDATGAGFSIGRDPVTTTADAVFRARPGDAAAEMVYTEASDPIVRLDASSSLVTGP